MTPYLDSLDGCVELGKGEFHHLFHHCWVRGIDIFVPFLNKDSVGPIAVGAPLELIELRQVVLARPVVSVNDQVQWRFTLLQGASHLCQIGFDVRVEYSVVTNHINQQGVLARCAILHLVMMMTGRA